MIESYDPATDSWSVLEYELPIDPRHVAVFEHRGRMLVVSTMSAGVVDLLWIDLHEFARPRAPSTFVSSPAVWNGCGKAQGRALSVCRHGAVLTTTTLEPLSKT